MEIWTGIASGFRRQSLAEVISAWLVRGVKIGVITWDDATWDGSEIPNASLRIKTERIQSWAENHNQLASAILGWDAYIVCNDDCLPDFDALKVVSECVEHYPDSVIYCDVDYHKNPAHFGLPIVTRKWYEANGGRIFNSDGFVHNCPDTDLFRRTLEQDKAVHCPRIKFIHKHVVTAEYADLEARNIASYSNDRGLFLSKWPDPDGRKCREFP